jgi:large subunit ribosomal protein L30
MAAKLKIKLVKSGIGAPPNLRQCLKGLGLSRMHRERELEDTPMVRGMIFKVRHLVAVDPPEAADKERKARA